MMQLIGTGQNNKQHLRTTMFTKVDDDETNAAVDMRLLKAKRQT